MKKIYLILSLVLIPYLCFAGEITRHTTYATNGEVNATNLNGNFDNVYNVVNGGLDNDNVNTTTYRLLEILGSLPSAGTQGRTAFLTTDSSLNFDTGTTWVKALTTGVSLPSGAIFFMITGSCPTGTTDVSATYANKFVKINSTQGTSSGTVLTGTTDDHTLITGEMPAHTHTTDYSGTAGGAINNGGVDAANGTAVTSSSTGGGGGHSHNLSAATTLEPSSITMKCCQVN
ncbi:hypothetical protein M0R04_11900 [Candidatus Dojkabacteria bacterium]|jgi:hypothetical protein|nr:hypothetical protein [Candidatus Dojkabacteria bacterium]